MKKNIKPLHRIDTFRWEGAGFQPFVTHRDWQVALMNWEPRFDPAHVGKVECHHHTDEVFILTHGKGLIFIVTDEVVEAIDMEPGVIYNVTAGTWHSVIGNYDSSWLIVESNDTSFENSEYRELTSAELSSLRQQYPAWLK
jgi:mannose-6-phosphate isomerase-like protein (cupin superfamily)